MSRCAWESLKDFFQEAVPVEDPVRGGEEGAVPGADAPPNNIEPHLDYSDSQIPAPDRHLPARVLQWQAGRSRSGPARRTAGGEAGGSYD